MRFFQGLSFTQWRYFQYDGAVKGSAYVVDELKWYAPGYVNEAALCASPVAPLTGPSPHTHFRNIWLEGADGFGAATWVRALFRLWGHQPRFLLGAARGTRKQHRGASRVNHLLARNSQLRYPDVRVAKPLILVSGLSVGWAPRTGSYTASQTLDRGFFFPNSYVPYKYRAWRGTATARLLQPVSAVPGIPGAAARGRAARQARRVYVHAAARGRSAGLGQLAMQDWRSVGGARRRPGRPLRLTALRRLFSPLRRLGRRLRSRGQRFTGQHRLRQLRPVWRRTLNHRHRRWLSTRLRTVQFSKPGRFSGPATAQRLRTGAPRSLVFLAQSGARPAGVVASLNPASRAIWEAGLPVLLEPQLADLLRRFRQPQVRYRPGFMRHWRQHRQTFCRDSWAPWGRRQKRLTQYVVRLRRVAAFSYTKLLQLTTARLLALSWLVGQPTPGQAWVLVNAGLLTVNGRACSNPLQQVYRGDVLGVITRSMANLLTNQKTPRLGWHVRAGTWGAQPGRGDTPAYLEVDELTSTICVLAEPRWITEEGRGGLKQAPFSTLKCYNWKYTT